MRRPDKIPITLLLQQTARRLLKTPFHTLPARATPSIRDRRLGQGLAVCKLQRSAYCVALANWSLVIATLPGDDHHQVWQHASGLSGGHADGISESIKSLVLPHC